MCAAAEEAVDERLGKVHTGAFSKDLPWLMYGFGDADKPLKVRKGQHHHTLLGVLQLSKCSMTAFLLLQLLRFECKHWMAVVQLPDCNSAWC